MFDIEKSVGLAVDLLTQPQFDSFEPIAYLCPSNVWTVGFGHTGPDVYEGLEITLDRAKELLAQDMKQAVDGISRLVKVDLNPNQAGALISFVFNIGVGAFAASTMLKKINSSDHAGAVLEFKRWNKGAGGKVLPGLVKRREEEAGLYGRNYQNE